MTGTDPEGALPGEPDCVVPETVPAAPTVTAPLRYDDIDFETVLGSGGSATVRRGTVTGESGQVGLAVKEPYLRERAGESAVERFRREAETWDRLDGHDHVVGVYDWGTDPHPWIALEAMDSGTLGDRTGDLAVDTALWVGARVADALHHAHRHGVAHLDLKPDNVLFRSVPDRCDVPKVSDWGLARLLIERPTDLDGISRRYAAPEQFDPEEFGRPDDRTDIYQLGVVLYEVLTGKRPFPGDGKQLAEAVRSESPSPPTDVASNLPAGLDDVLLTALAERKTDRYETVVDFRRDLEALRGSDDSTGQVGDQPGGGRGTRRSAGDGFETDSVRHGDRPPGRGVRRSLPRVLRPA